MKINKYIDHTYLKAFGTKDVIEKLCAANEIYNISFVAKNNEENKDNERTDLENSDKRL